MILPVFQQGSLFLATIVAGFVLAFFYDLFRVFRRVIPHKSIFIQVEDIIYWIIVIAVMFYFFLHSNSGEVRFFAIAGVFIGMLVYSFTLSRIFMRFSMKIYEFSVKFVLLFAAVIFAPFKVVLNLLSFPFIYITDKAKNIYKYEKRAYNIIKSRGKHKIRKMKNDFRIIFKKV